MESSLYLRPNQENHDRLADCSHEWESPFLFREFLWILLLLHQGQTSLSIASNLGLFVIKDPTALMSKVHMYRSGY